MVKPAMAMVAAWAILAAGCGGTLEGKYRKGELTTTTTGGTRAPASTVTTATTATTTTTVPTSGNAAGRAGPGEPEGAEPGGTIDGSAARRAVASPLGGRHR